MGHANTTVHGTGAAHHTVSKGTSGDFEDTAASYKQKSGYNGNHCKIILQILLLRDKIEVSGRKVDE